LKKNYCIAAVLLLSIITIVLHLLLHDRYRISCEDDVWSPGHAHTFVTTGLEIDRIFHTPSRKVIWSFGKTYDFLYGAFGSVFGWSRNSMHLLSKLLVLSGAFFWWGIVRRLGYSPLLGGAVFFGLLLIEPLVSTANISRKDALVFCLVALQLYLLIRGRFAEAACTVGIAFETHPLGSLAVFLSLGVLWMRRREWLSEGRWRKTVLLLLAGAVPAALYFILMLPDHFSLPALLKSYSKTNVFSGYVESYAWNNFFYVYLVHEKHLFQLFFYMIAIGLFLWKRDWREEKNSLILLLLMLGASVILKRPNHHYMSYATPVLLLFSFRTLERHCRWLWLAPLLFLILIGGYVQRYSSHSGYSNGMMSRRLLALVPEDTLPVVGAPDLWFAFHNRRFIPTHFQDPWKELQLQEFYFVEDAWAAKYDSWFYRKAVVFCFSNASVIPVGSTTRIGDFKLRVVRVSKG